MDAREPAIYKDFVRKGLEMEVQKDIRQEDASMLHRTNELRAKMNTVISA